MMEQSQPSNDCLDSICQLTEIQLKIAYTPMEEDASENVSEWENGDDDIDRNAFDAFNDEPDDE